MDSTSQTANNHVEIDSFERPGRRLTYLRAGSPGARPIVLLPPGLGEASYFLPLINRLRDQAFVIAPNMPGVGGSLFDGLVNMTLIADELAALLRSLSIDRPTLVGVSYGGSLSLELHRRLQVDRLLLCYCGEYMGTLRRLIYSVVFWPAGWSARFRSTLVKELHQRNLFDLLNHSPAEQLNIFHRWWDILRWRIPRGVIWNTPAFLLHSEQDEIVTNDTVDLLARLLPIHERATVVGLHQDCIDELPDTGFARIFELTPLVAPGSTSDPGEDWEGSPPQ